MSDALRRNPRKPVAGKKRLGGAFISGRGPVLLRQPLRGEQRCTVKVAYTPNSRGGDWSEHGRYLERESAGGERCGFDATGNQLSVPEALQSWQAAGDGRVFKFIISPEAAEAGSDLRGFVRRVMAKVEQELGTPLDWRAVEHHNTRTPHVHLVLRGVDGEGEPLTIHPAYIQHGIRTAAQLELTRDLGYQSVRDVLIARGREIQKETQTTLDAELTARRSSTGAVELSSEPPPSLVAAIRYRQLLARLRRLSEAGLAWQTDGAWILRTGFVAVLEQVEELKQRQSAAMAGKPFLTDKHAKLQVTELRPGQRLFGKILGSGQDEHSGRAYAFVEGYDSRLHYLVHDFSVTASGGELRAGKIAVAEANVAGVVVVHEHDRIPETSLEQLARQFAAAGRKAPSVGRMKTFANTVKALVRAAYLKLGLEPAAKPERLPRERAVPGVASEMRRERGGNGE